ncbi:MAG: DUF6505 family protein [Pseudomonadota bacterium]
MKLLRTIRFDGTDEVVFDRAAPVDEIAVSGSAPFVGITHADLTGKVRQAFANGFLGTVSGGRSTFATVVELSDAEANAVEPQLASLFESVFGAPDRATAEDAAGGEIAFTADLCRDVAINTVFTVRRTLNADGEIEEEFRQITPPSGEPIHSKIWAVEHEND